MTQPAETQKKSLRTLLAENFPKAHIALAAGLCLTLLITLMLFPSSKTEATRSQQTVQLSLTTDSAGQGAATNDEAGTATTSEAIIEPAHAVEWHEETVKAGDSLSVIFNRAGLSDRQLIELTRGNPEAKKLTKILPGNQLAFLKDDQDELLELRYQSDKLSSQLFTRTENGYSYTKETRKPDIQLAYRSGTIDNSLFLDGKKAGLNDRLIMELAGIFGWDIDFVQDIRKGDQFSVMYEEKFLDGEKLGDGAILAATFVNQKQAFRAVRYTDSKGDHQYYTPDGEAMRKEFLRAPLDFTRVSSGFNPNRLHPIFKTVRPHRGIDYAAPRGTPVYSAGNGRVIKSAYSKPNGNYIVIQHGNNVQTKYLHLNKRFVKAGQRVKQKQLIGKVGTTGYSTAPHLHYEFLLDGVHRNPRTILAKLPKAKSIPKQELLAFKQQVAPLLSQLASFEGDTRVASNQTTNRTIN